MEELRSSHVTAIPREIYEENRGTLQLAGQALPIYGTEGLYARLIKRAFDIAGSLVLIVLVSPILLIVALGVKLTSKGPVLFLQERVGKGGRLFSFVKFRSMHVNQEEFPVNETVKDMAEHGLLFKVEDDPRVTPFGRIIRKTSVDELPQVFNVLLGDMSFVGPRPLVDFMFIRHPEEKEIRCLVRPGITGFWQVYARSDSTALHQMLEYDLRYVEKVSLWTDLKLMLLTIPAVISCRGAK